MSQAGLSAILSQIAQSHQTKAEKRAFVPMPGGEAGAPAGAPMDPAAAQGGMDPMMMAAAQGTPPAELMQAQGMPVDPAMAAAAGAPVDPAMAGDPAAAGAAPAVPPEIQAAIDEAVSKATGGGGGGNGGSGGSGGSKAKADDRLAKIETMLSQVMGVLVGRGELPESALSVEAPTESEAPVESAPATASAPEAMGSPAPSEPAPKLAAVSPVPEKTAQEELQQARSAAQSMAELLGRLASR